MSTWPWVERTFTFDFPVAKHPEILERYRGTPVRLEERVRGLSRDVLTRHDSRGKWNILENIGHLLDLEPLWERRLDDYLAGAERLSAADMTNAATHAAGHGDRDAADLLAAFRRARLGVVARLERLGDADWARVSIHPRLNQPMRLVDAIAFTCDHDDYHLARMARLMRG
ncbi:MAG: DinB family protein [Phycisphaerales bacterium]